MKDSPSYMAVTETRRLAVCGLTELLTYLDGSASHVVSLIDPRLPFGRIPEVKHLILRVHDIDQDLPGHDAPTAADAEALLGFIAELAAEPDPVSLVIHCHAGISRSSATALAAMLVLNEGLDPAQAVQKLAVHRPQLWPNALLTGHFDRALGLNGTLIEAVAAYRRNAFENQ